MSNAKAQRRTKFENVFTVIRDELIDHFVAEGMPPEAVDWYRKVRFLPIAPKSNLIDI